METGASGRPGPEGVDLLSSVARELKRAEPESEQHSSPVLRSDVAGCGQVEGPGAERREAPPAAGLPCLSSNNSTEDTLKRINVLTGGHKRIAHALYVEVVAMAERFGVERLGFLTLTFSDNVQTIKEARRRFNSLATHVLKVRYERAIVVLERQKSGRIHFHLLIALPSDIRTGFDFDEVKRRNYGSAGVALRSEWKFWRDSAANYGFGRTELLPVKSNSEGIARYVGKYISKHVGQRDERDKGARFVSFIGYGPGDRRARTRFAWNTDSARMWRLKLAAWARKFRIESMESLKRRFGPRWAYHLQEMIMNTELGPDFVYSSFAIAMEECDRRFYRLIAIDRLERGLPLT